MKATTIRQLDIPVWWHSTKHHDYKYIETCDIYILSYFDYEYENTFGMGGEFQVNIWQPFVRRLPLCCRGRLAYTCVGSCEERLLLLLSSFTAPLLLSLILCFHLWFLHRLHIHSRILFLTLLFLLFFHLFLFKNPPLFLTHTPSSSLTLLPSILL